MTATTAMKPVPPAFDREAAFRPGYVVISTSIARGGVRYQRQDIDHTAHHDGSEDRRHLTDKHVDNVQVVKETAALVKLADYVLKQHCTYTAFGWFAAKANLSGLEEAYKPLREKADALNTRCRAVGSARRVHVGYVVAELVVDEYAAREIAVTIVDALKSYAEALRAGEVKDVKDASGKTIARDQVRVVEVSRSNLQRLSVGMAGDILKLALESIRPTKKLILVAIEAGATAADAGAAADLGSIENAIFFFSQGLL
jgi:hypothetical protein